MTARFSMLLKWRASPDMLRFSLCKEKRLAIRHMNRPLFPTNYRSRPKTQKVGRAKDLSAPKFKPKEIRNAGVQVYGKLILQARRTACQQETEKLNFITPWGDIPRILMSQDFQTFNWW